MLYSIIVSFVLWFKTRKNCIKTVLLEKYFSQLFYIFQHLVTRYGFSGGEPSVELNPIIITYAIIIVTIGISIVIASIIAGTTSFVGIEDLEVSVSKVVYNETGRRWSVTLTVKNTGTLPVTISRVLVNNESVFFNATKETKPG